MRTAALVYAGSLSPHALAPLAGGPSAYERVLRFVSSLPGLERCLILEGLQALPEALPEALPQPGPAISYSRVRREAWDAAAILEEAERFVASSSEPLEALVLLHADEALLDAELARTMLENYRRYRAEYSFADGYPRGLTVEILHPRILPAVLALARKQPEKPERGWLFSVIQKDINSFDVETEISPKDLRDERLDLAADTKRNVLLLERLMEAGVRDAESALRIIPARPELLRTLPAFIQVQVVGGCLQACSLCPYPEIGGDILSRRDYMAPERFEALMGGLEALVEDAVIDLSLWGEPSLHPDFPALVSSVLSRPGFSLIVETSGLGWRRETLESLARAWPERLHWVLSLDAASPELYGRLRGQGWDEARLAAEHFLSLFPKTAYVQMVRTLDNEEELELFWRGWKKRTENVIVQKYSRFASFLPERKVTDLSPLVRKPCWHVKRDLSILLDGSVPLCRDCARKEVLLGSLFEGLGAEDPGSPDFFRSALSRIWKAGSFYHGLHIEGRYPKPCVECDEHYTYNA